MKTPEELAEELDRQAVLYVSLKARNDVSYYVGMDCYKAGYQAAQEHAHAALEEAEARMQELQDQVAGVSKVMPDTCEHILDMGEMVDVNGWISVKDRLPEIPENGYSNRVLLLRADGFIVIGKLEKCVRFVRPLQEALIVETDNGDPIEEFTHWQKLPEPPKEEK